MFALVWKVCRYFVRIPAPAPPSSTSTQDSSLWFRLPLELREEIYAYHFSDIAPEPLHLSPVGNSVLAGPVAQGRHHIALLRTCKAVYTEAIPVLYAIHNIHLLISDPLVLGRRPSPSSAAPIIYFPKTLVCSRDHMLELITHRLKHVTITMRLTSASSHSHIVQKLAWILEILRLRESNLKHLTLHVLDNLSFFEGCCEATHYTESSRWNVYPERVLVETSSSGVIAGGESRVKGLLDMCADEWEVTVSVNEGCIAMRQNAEGHWKRLSKDLQGVEEALEGERSLWSGVNVADVWYSIQERLYWVW
jgi:hypothetical protein